jgi:NADPH-dependent F420 reductase
MRIALLGGTGDIGEGLALRWGRDTDHELVIGSRDPDRAAERAGDYRATLAERDVDATIEGRENSAAVVNADVVVLSVPPYYVADTVDAVADSLAAGAILVTPAVGISSDEDGFHYRPPDTGSVTDLVRETAPPDVPVVGAFHNLPAARLADLDADLDIDTLVLADEGSARSTILELTAEIAGLRALSAGPLANAPEVEALTPLLITVARYNDELADLGVTFQ